MKKYRIYNAKRNRYLPPYFTNVHMSELYLKSYVATQNYMSGFTMLHLRDFEIQEESEEQK
jgi:hypothetical protein